MQRVTLAVALMTILAALTPSTAGATPAFARQTGVSCSMRAMSSLLWATRRSSQRMC